MFFLQILTLFLLLSLSCLFLVPETNSHTRTYQIFYKILQDSYKYNVFAELILKHKINIEKIMHQDGFCAGFWYDLVVRNNAFQFLRPKEFQEAYSVAQANNKLKNPDNPYIQGGPKENLDPHTGSRKFSGIKQQYDNLQNRNTNDDYKNRGHREHRGQGSAAPKGYSKRDARDQAARGGNQPLSDKARERARNFRDNRREHPGCGNYHRENMIRVVGNLRLNPKIEVHGTTSDQWPVW
ncbi:hypothetical protein VP01_8788g1 [Puccinia sorghi]|uniref:Uncharacterized protein n=1 Tax=Puccinia sorghi TaxID=27349 RepID=A0A0L6U8G2_9BASI|nr:hypothetical protein VP01_8788g1 [Puccinia sorghi]